MLRAFLASFWSTLARTARSFAWSRMAFSRILAATTRVFAWFCACAGVCDGRRVGNFAGIEGAGWRGVRGTLGPVETGVGATGRAAENGDVMPR